MNYTISWATDPLASTANPAATTLEVLFTDSLTLAPSSLAGTVQPGVKTLAVLNHPEGRRYAVRGVNANGAGPLGNVVVGPAAPPPAVTTRYRDSVLADSPLAFFPSNETAGAVAVNAVAGGQNSDYAGAGIARVAPLTADSVHAYGFTGGSFTNGPVPAWNTATGGTIEVVVNLSATGQGEFANWGEGTAGIAIGRGNTNAGDAGNKFQLVLAGSATLFVPTSIVLATGINHIALSVDAGTSAVPARIYVNGALVGTVAISPVWPTGFLQMGGSPSRASNTVLSQLAIYATPLSGARIAVHAAARTVAP